MIYCILFPKWQEMVNCGQEVVVIVFIRYPIENLKNTHEKIYNFVSSIFQLFKLTYQRKINILPILAFIKSLMTLPTLSSHLEGFKHKDRESVGVTKRTSSNQLLVFIRQKTAKVVP